MVFSRFRNWSAVFVFNDFQWFPTVLEIVNASRIPPRPYRRPATENGRLTVALGGDGGGDAVGGCGVGGGGDGNVWRS